VPRPVSPLPQLGAFFLPILRLLSFVRRFLDSSVYSLCREFYLILACVARRPVLLRRRPNSGIVKGPSRDRPPVSSGIIMTKVLHVRKESTGASRRSNSPKGTLRSVSTTSCGDINPTTS
jgi:hypothetical protein